MAETKKRRSSSNGQGRKYRNKKTLIDGIVFDSKKEADRWVFLKKLEKDKIIEHLERQVEFELIPTTPLIFPEKHGKRTIHSERKCSYVADFVYKKGDRIIVEDVKGFRTPEYRIKKKLMLWRFGLQIKEV